MKSIAVLGAFDTKGAELAYLIDCIHALAPLADVISVDVSARAHEAVFSATIPNVEVARLGGGTLAALSSGDRLEAVTVMIEGAKRCIQDLYSTGRISGAITLGGQDLKKIPLSQLYDQVAFVSQDNYLFDESVRENIRMGRPSATDQEVEAVAKAAGCDEFIQNLEQGYDTIVGGGGAHLSGGERQRIAIARAMLKDAPIVVLDEATAYIDPENEALVQRAVGKLVAGRTVLVIAHRLSTITGADQIVVVNGGRIEATGKHEKLLETCPLYREMWQAHMGVKEGEQA